MNINILSDIYKKSLLENEKNVNFWEEYLKNLQSLDFSIYSDKLTVPVLVPIGNRIFFKGELKHTNEVTIALGADYFTKCSIKQAEVVKQHRIKDTQYKLETFRKEKEFLENQLSFGSQNVYENLGHDIIEVCSEEEDKAWREQHRERLRQYHKGNEKRQEGIENQMTDEDLWLKLEQLELQEELDNELASIDTTSDLQGDATDYDTLIIKKDDVSNVQEDDHTDNITEARITHNIPKKASKVNLLQQVISRQKVLEEKLTDLKYRERADSKTENDLINKLDLIDQLDEMEDEIDRLDDIIYEGNEDSNSSSHHNPSNIKRSVAFVDEDDSETIEISFTHSKVDKFTEPFDLEKGIIKPSDVYQVYSNLFANETTSILRKSKYIESPVNKVNNNVHKKEPWDEKIDIDNSTIVVKDVFEKTNDNMNIVDGDTRPTSLFKKRRQQRKS